MNVFEIFWQRASKYLFPVYCLRCGAEGDWLCGFCEALLPPVPIQRCIFCQALARCGETCATCRRRHYLDGLISRGIYGHWAWKGLIHSWKYRGAREIGARCARYLDDCLTLLPIEKPFTIVPIPLSRQRARQRGFNQSAMLAQSLGVSLNQPVKNLLARVRDTAPQSKLSPEERLDNVKDCFKFISGNEVKNGCCLLIDDIITTGATMDDAAKELKRAGASTIWGLVLVRGETRQ